jgi:23S rRNA (cytidine2498-2'-O)-methyltransferase
MTRAILTCSPFFIGAAMHELCRSHPQATLLEHLSPGYVFLESPYSFGKLTQTWRDSLPIYLHHLFPVHAVVALNDDPHDLALLKEAAEKIASDSAIVQIRAASDDLSLSYSLTDVVRSINPAQPTHDLETPIGRILSILFVRRATGLHAYMGVSWAAQNLSPWAGGQVPINTPVSNRAGYKLLEALSVFEIQLRRGDSALDLGASPGAWTTLLRARGMKVTAVAPTPMYPWLDHDPDVIYHPMTAEQYLACCQTTFDLIVNDMKLDARDSARLMVEYARHLRSEGIAIMTLKLRPIKQHRIMDHSFRLLRKAYKIIRVRQLVSNRHEVTLFLRRKD